MHSKKKRKSRKYLRSILIILMLLLASGGFYGGLMLTGDPSGKSIQTPVTLLDKLPIHTFLFPGLFILAFFGALPVLATIGLLFKRRFLCLKKLNPVKHWRWPVTLSFFIGIILTGWTAGELILWGMNTLSALFLGTGMAIALLAFAVAGED